MDRSYSGNTRTEEGYLNESQHIECYNDIPLMFISIRQVYDMHFFWRSVHSAIAV